MTKKAKKISLAIAASIVLASFAGVTGFAADENIAAGATPIYGT